VVGGKPQDTKRGRGCGKPRPSGDQGLRV
jgi:hypothetical protein